MNVITDTISRKAALDEIDKNRQTLLSLGMNEEEYILFNYGRRVIEELPIIDTAKHGKWIIKKELVPLPWDCDPLDCDNYDESTHSEWEEFCHCSICDYKSGHFRGTNYCPNCGAKMERSEDETD